MNKTYLVMRNEAKNMWFPMAFFHQSLVLTIKLREILNSISGIFEWGKKNPQTEGNSLNGGRSPELLNKKLSRVYKERKGRRNSR